MKNFRIKRVKNSKNEYMDQKGENVRGVCVKRDGEIYREVNR